MNSFYQVVIRPYGVLNADPVSGRMWPLDIVTGSGIDTIPGFVIEFSGIGKPKHSFPILPIQVKEEIKDAISNVESALAKHDRSAILEWYSFPYLRGFNHRIDAWEYNTTENSSEESKYRLILNYKRFIERFASDLNPTISHYFSDIDRNYLIESGFNRTRQLSYNILEKVIMDYKILYARLFQAPFPLTLADQLIEVINRLFSCWSESLNILERGNEFPLPTLSVNVRTGWRFQRSQVLTAGVLFSSSIQSDLHNAFVGYLSPLYSLEDIVSGIAPLIPLSDAKLDQEVSGLIARLNSWINTQSRATLRANFVLTDKKLFVDSIDFVEPSIDAAIVAAAITPEENKDSKHERILALDPESFQEPLHRISLLGGNEHLVFVGKGIAAAPGVCSGIVCIGNADNEDSRSRGRPTVLVSHSPDPELMKEILAAEGLVFATGGATSHVAVIARSTGKPCVLGLSSMAVDQGLKQIRVGGHTIKEGQWITIDGDSGSIYIGQADVKPSSFELSQYPESLLSYCDRIASVKVYVNADTGEEARRGFKLGAQGLGLCRLEHLLLSPTVLSALQRAMALSLTLLPLTQELYQTRFKTLRWPTSEGARAAFADMSSYSKNQPLYRKYMAELEAIRCFLTEQLEELFEYSVGRPVIIRLLDPPLTEFLSVPIVRSMKQDQLIDDEQLERLIQLIDKKDQMLGLRGIRLCHLAPELTLAQISAIFLSARKVMGKQTRQITVNIMAPFIIDPIELVSLRKIIDAESKEMFDSSRTESNYKLGCMIETPRAAMIGSDLAKVADFLSIGSNDLTQFTWACSRDSAESDFLGFFPYSHMTLNPFIDLDQLGVGQLISYCVTQARKTRPNIEIGVCGEHGSRPEAIKFFHRIGINYVSCSPNTIPAARLASAQASILEKSKE